MNPVTTIREALRMPRVTIDLMLRGTAGNDPFYERLVREFHAEASGPHPKWRLVAAMEWGVALTLLPERFDDYFMLIEASARRNYKKAQRHGCICRGIDYNHHLAEIAAIRASTPIRQGRVSEAFLHGEVKPCANPPSRSGLHAYPYFGVFLNDQLVAYAGCAVMGEVALIEHIYGHADYQALGVTPMLVIGIAEAIIRAHPAVRYFGYGTFFGAAREMQRFKRKLGFYPHRVRWNLGTVPPASVDQLVFRKVVGGRCPEPVAAHGLTFFLCDTAQTVWDQRSLLIRCLGWGGWLKTLAKAATPRRCFFGVSAGHDLIHTGWLSLGFCRYYAVEENAVVVGPIWTDPAARGRGAATLALNAVVREMFRRSRAIVYIDTSCDNTPCLKVIEKCGFGPAIGTFGK